jgi:putative spermidine/putrescine transport system substrate-binding protein
MNRVFFTRRNFCLTLAVLPPITARADQTLRVLAWPGYADPDIVKQFEQRAQVRVEVTTIDSDVDLWQKVRSNNAQDFDLFAVNTAELQRYIKQDLVQPIPLQDIPNLSRQLIRFRNQDAIPGLRHNGNTYAIPYTYSEMGLIYDRKQMPQPPDSLDALWDPRWKGKVVGYNGGAHSFSLAAQMLRLRSPFQIDDKSWTPAVERLVALRRNAAGFYTQPEEAVALFKARKAALLFANFGRQQLQLMQKAGLDVGYAIPKEGALAWLDCWAMTRGARNPALAAAWINYMLEPEPGQALVSRQGLGNTTTTLPDVHAEDRILWLEPVESEEQRELLWARIMAGDRISKVLSR